MPYCPGHLLALAAYWRMSGPAITVTDDSAALPDTFVLGPPRWFANPVTFERAGEHGLRPIRHYGAADTVTIRILEILAMVMHHTDTPTRQEALLRRHV